jgi:uncharacterized PurR-regulated membrane protein YhhQ (DUF165 family)
MDLPRKDTEFSRSIPTYVSALAVIVVAAYIAAQMISDVASLKIGIVLGLSVDMGTFIYPATFTLRDLVHKTLGKRNAQVLVITAGIINLFMAGYLLWVSRVQGDPSWGKQAEFAAVWQPVWRWFWPYLAEVGNWRILCISLVVTRVTRRNRWFEY